MTVRMCAAWLLLNILTAAAVAMPPRVFVSIAPQRECVERIGGGLVTVDVLVPPGANPETYSLGPRKLSALGRSQVFFRIGVPFEEQLLKKIHAAFPDLAVVDTRDGMSFREMGAEEQAAHEHMHHHGGHGHEGGHEVHHGHADHAEHEVHSDHDDDDDDVEKEEHCHHDPHVWLSIGNMLVHAQCVAETLCGMFPQESAAIRRRAADYCQELEALDESIRLRLQPLAGHEAVVFHPAFGYFLTRYGLKQCPVELDGKEPAGRHLCDVIREARRDGLHVIYVQPQFNSKAAEVIAHEIHGAVMVLDPLPEHYLDGMEKMCRALLKLQAKLP